MISAKKEFSFASVDKSPRKIYVWMYENGSVVIEKDRSMIGMKIDDLMHILQMYPFPIKLTSEMEGLIDDPNRNPVSGR